MNPYARIPSYTLICWYILVHMPFMRLIVDLAIVCPFLCLLIGPHPPVHCIAATDWPLGTTRCCLSTLAVPYNTTCLDLTNPQLYHSRLRGCAAITIAEFSSTISWRWRGRTSHIQIRGHPARQMFVNTFWSIYDIRISHNSQISHSSHPSF